MNWLTWRQSRTQLWILLAVFAVAALPLLVTVPEEGAASADTMYAIGKNIMFALPAVIGLFAGAPLIARELETGTYRFIWNQSITRTRWLTVKLLVNGLGTAVSVGLLSLIVGSWSRPIDDANMTRVLPELFGARGIVPIAYALFAFVVGVTAGAITRRTVPAMAITLVVVIAASALTTFLVRPHLAPLGHEDVPITTVQTVAIGPNGVLFGARRLQISGAWIVSSDIVSGSRLIPGPGEARLCDPVASSYQTCEDWIASLHLRNRVTYQPASHFWPLQWAESAILLVVTAALTWFCFWWTRRRLT